MYTDGVTEAMNKAEEEFGESRMISALAKFREHEPDRILESLVSEVSTYSDGHFTDDLTLIICKVQ